MLGISPDDIAPPEIDETPQKGEHPRAYVTRIAREKVAAVSSLEYANIAGGPRNY